MAALSLNWPAALSNHFLGKGQLFRKDNSRLQEVGVCLGVCVSVYGVCVYGMCVGGVSGCGCVNVYGVCVFGMCVGVCVCVCMECMCV